MIARLLLAALACLSLGFAAAPSAAAPAKAAPLTAADRALVDRAAAYLNTLRQVRGSFVQTDPRGGVTRGELWLNRPGKARFEYQAPSSRVVVADGAAVLVHDPRLKSFDRYPLGSTPLSLFLQRNISLDGKVEVVRVDRVAGGFAIVARDPVRRSLGHIVLTFAEGPVRLREWAVVDAQGGRTTVRLNELRQVAGLDPALFVLRNPTRTAAR